MEKSSFFNAVLDSSGVPDRPYLAESFARYFGSFIGNGVFPTPSTNLQVVADSTSMDIALKAGKGWINGYFYENTEDLTLNVAVADGVLNRIDRVVLRLDFINREIKAYVKKGTFASSPVAPNLTRNSDMYELGIADIKVNKGVTKIVQADITDLRQNNNYCGLVAGVLKQIDTTDLFAQFQSTFDIWFEAIKGQLSTDAAGNLQNQIDNIAVGVENIIFDTSFANIWGSTSGSTVTLTTDGQKLTTSSANMQVGMQSPLTKQTIPTKKYTLSLEARGNVNRLDIYILRKSGSSFPIIREIGALNTTEFRKIKITFTYTAGTDVPEKIFIGGTTKDANEWIEVKKETIMLTEGEKQVIGWIPSSTEIQNSINGKFGSMELKKINDNLDSISTSRSVLGVDVANGKGVAYSQTGFRPNTNSAGTYNLGELNYLWNIIYGKELNLNNTFFLRNRSVNEDEIRTTKKNLNFCSTHTDGTEVGFLLDTLGGGTAALRPYAGNALKIDLGSTTNRLRDIFLGSFNWNENGMTNITNQIRLVWGTTNVDLPYGGSANKLINFPLPFANECYAAFATADYDVAGDSRAATAGVIANAGVLKSSPAENKTQLWLTIGHTPVASTGWGSGTRPIRVRWFTIGH